MKINIINNNDNNIFNNFDIKLKEPINSLDVDISCNFIANSTLLKKEDLLLTLMKTKQ